MKLVEHQQLQTSGARDVGLFEIQGETFLAIPQLAEDIAGDPPNMNGGNSEVDVLIYQWRNNEFHEYQRIPCHGNEHVNFHEINGRYFLAVACIRSGKQPDFKMDTSSMVFEWLDGKFVEFQSFATFAAKGCKFFTMDNKHYLAFSEGVKEPGNDEGDEYYTHIYCWNDNQFDEFQSLPAVWGYDISFFQIDERYFFAFGDNLSASTIYEWDGERFVLFQQVAEQGGGRQFCYFMMEGSHYIAFANLLDDSVLYKWDGKRFLESQVLEGSAGRNFHVLEKNNETYLFRTNFITGTREAPITEMDSTVYRWANGRFSSLLTYKTFGGTSADSFDSDGRTFLVVSNSLDKDTRFQTPSMVYEIIM